MTDRLQKWTLLSDTVKNGQGDTTTFATFALELPHGCVLLVPMQGMVFVPGVRISDCHGVCITTPARENREAEKMFGLTE